MGGGDRHHRATVERFGGAMHDTPIERATPTPAIPATSRASSGEVEVTLAQCPIGLFMCSGELCLKTEHGNNEGRVDAYIVSSGEFFWGHAPQSIANQRQTLVRPIDAATLAASSTSGLTDGGDIARRKAELEVWAKQLSDQVDWQPADTAPKDGTLIELVVDYTDGHSPLMDAIRACTVGWNGLADTGEDEWHFFGWDWCQDHVRGGAGKVIAWRPSRLNACDDALPPLPALAQPDAVTSGMPDRRATA